MYFLGVLGAPVVLLWGYIIADFAGMLIQAAAQPVADVAPVTPTPPPAPAPAPKQKLKPKAPKQQATSYAEKVIYPIITRNATTFPVPYARQALASVVSRIQSGRYRLTNSCTFRGAVACLGPHDGHFDLGFHEPAFRQWSTEVSNTSFEDEVVLTAVHEWLHDELGHFDLVDQPNGYTHESEVRWRTTALVVLPGFCKGRFREMSENDLFALRAYASSADPRSRAWQSFMSYQTEGKSFILADTPVQIDCP